MREPPKAVGALGEPEGSQELPAGRGECFAGWLEIGPEKYHRPSAYRQWWWPTVCPSSAGIDPEPPAGRPSVRQHLAEHTLELCQKPYFRR